MQKTVLVRKNRGRKIGVRFFSVSLIIFLGILIVCAQNAHAQFATLCTPMALSSFVLLVYFETWKVSFSSDRVTKQVFFIIISSFPYSQIKDVVASYSSTEYDHIRIVPLNGKQIVFRMDDQNAGKALSIIASHHSVQRMSKHN